MYPYYRMENNQDINHGRQACYSPKLFDPTISDDRLHMDLLRAEVPGIEVFDQIELQLRDLIKLLYPKKPLSNAEYNDHIAKHLGGTEMAYYGRWVYYPWRKALVHVLPQEEFVRVRTIRNAYKITLEEQAQLASKKVGIIGLSVGQSAALAVAIERAAGEIRIADFDTLELSNLNRIRSSVCNLGLPKTHMVAREIAELDPYLPVKVFEEGITELNIEAFLTADGPLDLLIEECDSVDIKVLAREYARKHRIPVLMDTSDRGMIDVERYDLDPNYPILHGLIDPSVDFAFLRTLQSSEEKLPYIAPILGIDTMSIRLRASALEVGQSISTWPQLGGDVMQGGALCVHHAKEILLGRSHASGRVFAHPIEKEKKHNNSKHRRYSDEMLLATARAFLSKCVWPQGLHYEPIDSALFESITTIGTRASTPGNSQALKWVLADDTIVLCSDRSFKKAFSDNFGFGSLIGYGCVFENLAIFLQAQGFRVESVFGQQFDPDQPNAVFAVRVVKGAAADAMTSLLCAQLERRETTRIPNSTYRFSQLEQQLIGQLADKYNCRLLADAQDVRRVKELTLYADVIRMTNAAGFHDLFKEELIWSKEEYERVREGIFVGDLNLNVKEKVGVDIYNNANVNEFLRKIKGGNGFGELSEKYLEGDTVLLVYTVPNFELNALIEVGRAIERSWLELTANNLSMHPFTSSVMIASYLASDKNGYLQNTINAFQQLWSTTLQQLNLEGTIIFIAKVTPHSGLAKASSLRKSSQQLSLYQIANKC